MQKGDFINSTNTFYDVPKKKIMCAFGTAIKK